MSARRAWSHRFPPRRGAVLKRRQQGQPAEAIVTALHLILLFWDATLGVCAPEDSARSNPQHVGVQLSNCYRIWYQDRRKPGQNRSAAQAPRWTYVSEPIANDIWCAGSRAYPKLLSGVPVPSAQSPLTRHNGRGNPVVRASPWSLRGVHQMSSPRNPEYHPRTSPRTTQRG